MEWKNIGEKWKKTEGLDRFLFLIVCVGAVVIGISLFRGILMDRQVQVEYLNPIQGETINAIRYFVDIEGAVMMPGVYELAEGSRIKDVLVAAGGLADRADRDFCEKNINMAELIKDGQKIYIPSRGVTGEDEGYFEAMALSKMVSINSATTSELDTLWGIGQAKAELIVKNRPYQNLDELVSKKIISQSVLDRNRELMSVY